MMLKINILEFYNMNLIYFFNIKLHGKYKQ